MSGELLTAIAAAATTGLLGNLHCVAMCGPLAAAGCSRDGRVSGSQTLGYVGGRIVSYALVGAVMGQMGQHALHVLPVNVVQIAAAVTVAAVALWRAALVLWPRRAAAPVVQLGKPSPASPSLLASVLPKRGLGLGLATGILPCGLLLAGWALAAGTAHAPSGAAVMAVFALATAPGPLVPVLGHRLVQRFLGRIPALVQGLAWCALAAWVALRPLWIASHGGQCH